MHRSMPKTLPQFLWHFCSRYKFNLLGMIFVCLWWATTISLSPYMVKMMIDRVSALGSTITSPEALFSALQFPAIGYILLSLMLGVAFRCYDLIVLRTLPKLKRDITSEMFAFVELHSYTYYQQRFSGSIANKINDMSRGTIKVILDLTEVFLARTFIFLIASITMYTVHPLFSIVLLTWGIIFISVSLFLSRQSQRYSEICSEVRSTIVGKIVDSISNILNVKLFARERFEREYLTTYLDDGVNKDRTLQWYLFKVKLFYALSITTLLASMVAILIYMRAYNMVTVGDFALILGLSGTIVETVWDLVNQLVPFSEEVGTCKQALSIISTPHELVDAPNAQQLHVTKGKIVFEKVHFQYRKDLSLFADKSIVINPGEKVGLVGFSGSGKSTFVNLILRFYDIDSGKILIDNQDIKTVTQESLRSQIAMIPQDPSLFHRSLMENIRFGRLDATDEEVVECAKRAHCHESIVALKDGYHALVGERGVKLSGGQRQRIAIARAFLKDAPILILDEATSSLDSITEHYIQESLLSLMKGRTTIVIAHRLSTLFNMDRILVFSNGRIIEDGTHKELLERKGHYAELWEMQVGGFIGRGKDKSEV